MFVKIVDGVPTPYSQSQLRRDNPNVSFPRDLTDEVLLEFGAYKVKPPIKPDFNEDTQKLLEGDLAYIDGAWRKLVTVVDLSPEELQSKRDAKIRELTMAIQLHLDSAARERGYDSMFSLSTYISSTNTVFQAEAAAGVRWRDDVWTAANTILSDVLAGNRSAPTKDQLLAELPVINWPGV